MATSTNRLINTVVLRLQSSLPALVLAEGLSALKSYKPHDLIRDVTQGAPYLWVEIAQASASEEASEGASIGRRGYYVDVRTVMIGCNMLHSSPDKVSGDLRSYVDLIRQCLETKLEDSLDDETFIREWQSTDYSPPVDVNTAIYREAITTWKMTQRRQRGWN